MAMKPLGESRMKPLSAMRPLSSRAPMKTLTSRFATNGKPGVLLVDSLGEEIDLLGSDIERAELASVRYDAQNDHDFYCVVYFRTTAQREAFVKGMGWESLPDPADPRFIDGESAAELQGITLPDTVVSLVDHPPKEKWAEIAEELPENKKGHGLPWPPI